MKEHSSDVVIACLSEIKKIAQEEALWSSKTEKVRISRQIDERKIIKCWIIVVIDNFLFFNRNINQHRIQENWTRTLCLESTFKSELYAISNNNEIKITWHASVWYLTTYRTKHLSKWKWWTPGSNNITVFPLKVSMRAYCWANVYTCREENQAKVRASAGASDTHPYSRTDLYLFETV